MILNGQIDSFMESIGNNILFITLSHLSFNSFRNYFLHSSKDRKIQNDSPYQFDNIVGASFKMLLMLYHNFATTFCISMDICCALLSYPPCSYYEDFDYNSVDPSFYVVKY